jgi:histidinol-phosphatase
VNALAPFLATAEAIVREARAVVLDRLRGDVAHQLKADGSFVTDIDLAVEDLVRARLRTAFPDHGIIGEEREDVAPDAAYQWVIDPIDGTHSLRHRIPLFSSLLALLHDGRAVLGIIDLPMLDRMYAGARGLGAFCNGRRLELRDVVNPQDIAREVIAVGERKQFARCGRAGQFDRVMQAHDHVRTYCDAFGHALAIEGSAGAMIEADVHVWDIAASQILIEEAGGAFVRLNREPRSTRKGGHYDVVFGKPAVVEWVCRHVETGA